MNDRRLWFFLVAAAVCGLLVPASPGEFRWVPQALVVVYVVLAALVALEIISGRGNGDPPSGISPEAPPDTDHPPPPR